jgi:hypothetical protein
MEPNKTYKVVSPSGEEEYFATYKECKIFIQRHSKGNQELAKQYVIKHLEAVQAKMHVTTYWRKVGPKKDC